MRFFTSLGTVDTKAALYFFCLVFCVIWFIAYLKLSKSASPSNPTALAVIFLTVAVAFYFIYLLDPTLWFP